MLERSLYSIIISGAVILILWWLGRGQHKRANKAIQSYKTSGKARLLYFYGRSCATCATQLRIFAQLSTNLQSLIEPIDVEQEDTVAKQYNIMTLPTTVIVDGNGRVQHINYGLANLSKLNQQLQALA